MTELAHTVDEALTRFALVEGVGDGDTTACPMSALNWIRYGDGKWTDAPECAHPLIRSVVIQVSDDERRTTPAMRAEIVRAGEHGILDTWWIPTEVVVWALSHDRGTDPPTPFDRLMTVLRRVATWKDTRARINLAGADLTDANLTPADLTRADLTRANLAGANLTRANLTDANLTRANLAGVNLTNANLTDAKGSAATVLPAGWMVSDAGLIVCVP